VLNMRSRKKGDGKKSWKPRVALHFQRDFIPNTFEDVLKQIFPKHERRQNIALFLINKLKQSPIPSEDWLLIETEYAVWEAENVYYSTINPKIARELYEYTKKLYKDLELSNTKRNKLILEKASELGLNLNGITKQFWIVTKTLNNMRMIYKKDNVYYLSRKGFSKLLRRIAEIVEDYIFETFEESEDLEL